MSQPSDERFMREALALAARGLDEDQMPVGGVIRDQSLTLMRTYVARHAERAWLQAMLPGFSYSSAQAC